MSGRTGQKTREMPAPKLRMRLNPNEGQVDGAKKIVILGLPNSGKSRLSNDLSGAYDIVSNYAQTTVEAAHHACTVEGQHWDVVDTPGLHGLYLQSEDELPVRDLLFRQPPDIVVQCVDAHRLRESLLLTADLMDLGIPLVLVLTAVGESARRGVRIEPAAQSRAQGVPVVPSPRPGAGSTDVRRLLLSPPPPPAPARFDGALEPAVARAAALLARHPFPRASGLLLLEDDPSFRLGQRGGEAAAARGAAWRGEAAANADEAGEAAAVREAAAGGSAALSGKVSLLVSEQRNRWVDRLDALAAARSKEKRGGPAFAETFARLCRHPLYGLPILASFLVLIYVMVVSVAGSLSLFLTTAVTDPVVAAVGRLLPGGFLHDLFIGPQGLLTLGLFNSLTTVLPILTIFFFVFGILEDVGYLPNLAILTRRFSARLGITGNAVIPLVLGLGCKTMATMTARTIPSRKEKLIVVALIAFAIPCSAQMGLSIAILGQHGFGWFIAAFAFLATAEVGVGLLLNKLIPNDAPDDFIQELPPIRAPRIAAVARKTGHRLLWFLKEAIPIFLAAALALFVLERTGILGLIKQAVRPLITGFLGLPIDMVDALLLTLARSEAAAGLVLRMSRSGVLTGAQSVVAVVLITTFSQCFANIAAMTREVGAKASALIVASIYVAAFLVSGAVHGLLLLAGRVLPL
jgi:ferrous iron transport protein B